MIREWLSQWRIERHIQVPHADVTVMTPWAFVRVLWYYNRRPFQAYPSAYETGIIIGWRWPWRKWFKEHRWIHKDNLLMAIYGAPMDTVYLARVVRELDQNPLDLSIESTRHIGEVARKINQYAPACPHQYWIASCPTCARKAFLHALALSKKAAKPRIQESEEQRRLRHIEDYRLGRPHKTIAEAEEDLAAEAAERQKRIEASNA